MNPNNVTPLEDWKKAKEEMAEGESALSDLLQHMRQVRDTMPVNTVLRDVLRNELRERSQGDAEKNTMAMAVKPWFAAHKGIWITILAAVVLCVSALFIWNMTYSKVLDVGESRVIGSFNTDGAPFTAAFQQDGSMVLLSRNGYLLLLDEASGQYQPLNLPVGTYGYPTWSAQNKLALIHQEGNGKQDIVVANLPAQMSPENRVQDITTAIEQAEIWQKGKEGLVFTGLNWSPDGKLLAYSAKDDGQEEKVYVMDENNSSSYIGLGSHPTWSPDAKGLVLQRKGEKVVSPAEESLSKGQKVDNELWLVDREKHEETLLGQGNLPSWGQNGYLVYMDLKLKENTLSYLPNGLPQFTSQQIVGEVRSIQLGRSLHEAQGILASAENQSFLGKGHLMVSADDDFSDIITESQWLRQLALEGVQEPRTLRLDATKVYDDLAFGPNGDWFITTKKSHDTMVLTKVFVEERRAKGVE